MSASIWCHLDLKDEEVTHVLGRGFPNLWGSYANVRIARKRDQPWCFESSPYDDLPPEEIRQRVVRVTLVGSLDRRHPEGIYAFPSGVQGRLDMNSSRDGTDLYLKGLTMTAVKDAYMAIRRGLPPHSPFRIPILPGSEEPPQSIYDGPAPEETPDPGFCGDSMYIRRTQYPPNPEKLPTDESEGFDSGSSGFPGQVG